MTHRMNGIVITNKSSYKAQQMTLAHPELGSDDRRCEGLQLLPEGNHTYILL